MDTPTENAKRTRAREILAACNIAIGADFYTLAASQVDALLEHATTERYRKPANANGSRGRYYHALLQRRAGSAVSR